MFIRFLPIFLLLIPIAEISVFILVGQYIGLLPTLALIFATAVLGSVLLRVQGFGLLRRLTAEANAGRVPSRELVHGGMIVVAAILLITPGFITDIIGFLLFIPPVRDLVWSFVKSRVTIISNVSGFSTGPDRTTGSRGPDGAGPIVDLDNEEFHRNRDPNSPWSGPRIDRE